MKRAGVLATACLARSSSGCLRPQAGRETGHDGNGVPDGGYGAACPRRRRTPTATASATSDEGKATSSRRATPTATARPTTSTADSDGDGIPDAVEGGNANPCMAPVDSDSDGKPDYVDLDSDDANDSTVGDREEVGPDPLHPVDSDGDGTPDYLDPTTTATASPTSSS